MKSNNDLKALKKEQSASLMVPSKLPLYNSASSGGSFVKVPKASITSDDINADNRHKQDISD